MSEGSDWTWRFDELDALDEADRDFLRKHARRVQLPAQARVFAPGQHPDAFLLVLEGQVCVHQYSASGREIVLYRVNGGESCIMTTACLLSDEDYLAEGITETPVTALALARADFDALVGRSPAFRRLVFSRYASRVTRLMALLEDLAFERLDKRLARKLLELSAAKPLVDTTHQALAVELGSAREVVSRHMKDFVRRGLVSTARGHVRIVDRAGLQAIAEQKH